MVKEKWLTTVFCNGIMRWDRFIMNDCEQPTFGAFMTKMLIKFAFGRVHCVGTGYYDRKLDYLKLINDNMKKFKKYIRKYDIMIVEHNGVLVFFPTRLLNLEKRSKLIEEAKKI